MEVLIEVAREKELLGDYIGAISTYSSAIEQSPDSEHLYILRGCAKRNSKNFIGAIEDFSVVIDLIKLAHSEETLNNITTAYYLRAETKAMLADFDGAIIDITQSIKIANGSSHGETCYALRADVNFKIGLYKAALEDYRKEIDSYYSGFYQYEDGLLADLYFKIGNSHSALKEMDEARKAYHESLLLYNREFEKNGPYAFGLYKRGLVKESLKDNAGALGDYDKAIQSDPNFLDAYNKRYNLLHVHR